MKENVVKNCLVCGRGDEQVPLLRLDCRGKVLWICPQHLPVLIHDPGSLAGKLPGAENLRPHNHKD